jgi:LPS-assembly lipoprotein
MSCFDRRTALALLLVALSGCGFHPLYAEMSPLGYDPALASVEVRPVPDRIGQILVASVRDQLNPHGTRVKPRYMLFIVMSVTGGDLGIRRDNTSSRGELSLSADVTLSESGANAVVFQDSLRTVTSYNRPDDAYASTVTEDHAREQAAEDLGREIAQRVAVYLRRQRAGAGT